MTSSTAKIKTWVTYGSLQLQTDQFDAQSSLEHIHEKLKEWLGERIPRDYSVLFYDKLKSKMVKIDDTVLTNGSGPFHGHGTIIDPSTISQDYAVQFFIEVNVSENLAAGGSDHRTDLNSMDHSATDPGVSQDG